MEQQKGRGYVPLSERLNRIEEALAATPLTHQPFRTIHQPSTPILATSLIKGGYDDSPLLADEDEGLILRNASKSPATVYLSAGEDSLKSKQDDDEEEYLADSSDEESDKEDHVAAFLKKQTNHAFLREHADVVESDDESEDQMAASMNNKAESLLTGRFDDDGIDYDSEEQMMELSKSPPSSAQKKPSSVHKQHQVPSLIRPRNTAQRARVLSHLVYHNSTPQSIQTREPDDTPGAGPVSPPRNSPTSDISPSHERPAVLGLSTEDFFSAIRVLYRANLDHVHCYMKAISFNIISPLLLLPHKVESVGRAKGIGLWTVLFFQEFSRRSLAGYPQVSLTKVLSILEAAGSALSILESTSSAQLLVDGWCPSKLNELPARVLYRANLDPQVPLTKSSLHPLRSK